MSDASTTLAFAEFGCAKMLYDIRSGPHAVEHENVIYIVYQANADVPEGHPHTRSYDIGSRTFGHMGYWTPAHRFRSESEMQ